MALKDTYADQLRSQLPSTDISCDFRLGIANYGEAEGGTLFRLCLMENRLVTYVAFANSGNDKTVVQWRTIGSRLSAGEAVRRFSDQAYEPKDSLLLCMEVGKRCLSKATEIEAVDCIRPHRRLKGAHIMGSKASLHWHRMPRNIDGDAFTYQHVGLELLDADTMATLMTSSAKSNADQMKMKQLTRYYPDMAAVCEAVISMRSDLETMAREAHSVYMGQWTTKVVARLQGQDATLKDAMIYGHTERRDLADKNPS